jgi:hypothetical protein
MPAVFYNTYSDSSFMPAVYCNTYNNSASFLQTVKFMTSVIVTKHKHYPRPEPIIWNANRSAVVSTVVVVEKSLGLIVLPSVNQFCLRNTLACNKALIVLKVLPLHLNIQGSSRCMPEGGFFIYFFLVLQSSSILAWMFEIRFWLYTRHFPQNFGFVGITLNYQTTLQL